MSATRAGPYRLLRVIGEGGMGVVHLGLDPADRAVAVKVVRPHVAADPQTRDRLAREVRSLSRVKHPRLAEVLDADFDAELPYVVMRYVPGEALDAVVRRDGPLARAQLDELAVGLFEAVSAIHSVGVVHRDLKPGNVLLLDGSPVVIDFGIARALDDVSLTSTGLMVGTPGYLSPEVLDGTDVGTAADWWGWGAVVAFASTGRPPFRSGPMEAVWDRVRRGAADLEGVDAPLARVLAATLRPDARTRPSPEQLADGIASLTGRRPVSSDVAWRDRAPAPVDAGVPRGGLVDAGVPRAPAAVDAGIPRREATTRVDPRPGPPTTGRVAPSASPAPARPMPMPDTRVVERPPPPTPVAPLPLGPARARSAAMMPTAPQALVPRAPAAVAPVAAAGGAPAVPPASGSGLPPVLPLPRRPLLSLLGLAVVVAVAAVTPAGAALVVLLWATAARAVQWTRVAAAMSRVRAGRLTAAARTGLGMAYPLRLAGALLVEVGYLLLGWLVLSPLLLVAAVLLTIDIPYDDTTTLVAVLTAPPLLSGAAAVTAVLAWYGPGGRAVREGSRAMTEPVARSRNGMLALLGSAALLVLASVIVVLGSA